MVKFLAATLVWVLVTAALTFICFLIGSFVELEWVWPWTWREPGRALVSLIAVLVACGIVAVWDEVE